ncbi:MAG: sulfatase [Bacteroidetes Order II. Incertae sedis bacterium]|jgi:arylsulfatase A-like enzyme|nr:sulfatase [Bacteroidetes Order II. bacterium]MBT4601570.1 sulfatase [Bacteroidetes Order II. bacterium]MBT5250419.1 sulfatase [Bacteroidetes Order II. bacterium]MBT6201402.1 sulfatase [Bacteroidetes Order II. bacterium]MBT6423765.1 sulfatase [Bacteroidetes Order II. bacterium]
MKRLLPLLLVLAGCQAAPKPPPNILLIFTDDHASSAISAYGSTFNTTPNIDRIAAEGMLFENCLVTNSICAPSRATILTGKYNHLNGQIINGPAFDGSQQTFPKLLQQAGYTTAMIGKWHLRSAPTGFDHYEVLVGQGPYYNPPIRTATDTTIVEGYTTDILTDMALNWLDEGRDGEKPFMLMYQHKAPHRNWQPGPDHIDDFVDQEFEMPATFYDDYATRSSAAGQAVMRIDDHLNANDLKITPPRNLTEAQMERWMESYGPRNEELRESGLSGDDLDQWKYNRYMRDYLRSVQSVDDNIGRVLDYLDETGLAENTVVVYSSDQGWYLGEHGWYDKRWMYEPSLKTPFIVRWPESVDAGVKNETMVSNVDFAPTFLDIAGAAIPADMQGKSLIPVLEGGTDLTFRDAFYYQYYEYPGAHCVRRHYGVRTDRYKLIYFYGIDEWEMFDLQEDPDEVRSVYGSADYADIEAGLKVRLTELREEYEVPEDTRPIPEEVCTYTVGWMGYDAG